MQNPSKRLEWTNRMASITRRDVARILRTVLLNCCPLDRVLEQGRLPGVEIVLVKSPRRASRWPRIFGDLAKSSFRSGGLRILASMRHGQGGRLIGHGGSGPSIGKWPIVANPKGDGPMTAVLGCAGARLGVASGRHHPPAGRYHPAPSH